MEQEQAFHAKLVHCNNFMKAVMLVFSKDNTPATFQYHAYILHHMYSEREIQEVPCETGKSMKCSRSAFGSKTSVQSIPFISVKEKYIFSPQFKISCVLFHNLTEALRKHSAPLIYLACLSQGIQTPMSEKAYCLMIKAKGLGIKPPGLFYRKK